MQKYKEEIIKLIKSHLDVDSGMIEQPPGNIGDYAVPCYKYAKEQKKSPNAIAENTANALKPTQLIEKIKSTGPYINFFVNKKRFAKDVLTDIKKDYGKKTPQKGKVMIEYSQVNTHKAFHVGHLRGTFLGASLVNIHRFSGHNVVSANYQGDIGAHVAKVIWYLESNDEKSPVKHKGRWLGQIYQKSNALAEDNKDAISLVLQKLEQGDSALTKLWKETRQWSLDDFEDFYKLVGVKFDKYFFESQYETAGKKIVNSLLNKKIAEKSEGAVIIDLNELGKFLLLKSDGTALYSTKDLALASDKFRKFGITESVYVVGAEQKLYFQQIFASLEKMGFKQASACQHIPYGLVNLKGGKISSREGELIYAEELVEDVIETAKEAIIKRHSDLSEKDLVKRAQAIGLAALKFSFLNQDNNKEIIFDKESSLNFEGETGPYVQYAYARIASIMRKADMKRSMFMEVTDEEHMIVRQLDAFPEIISEACSNFKPSTICRYLLDLCQLFNQYYHSTPILKAETEIRSARLQLLHAVQKVLDIGLSLLGINTVERM